MGVLQKLQCDPLLVPLLVLWVVYVLLCYPANTNAVFCNVILWNNLLSSISDQFNFCCCLRRWCCYVTKLIENTDVINWNWVISSIIYFKSLCPALRTSLAWAGYLHHHTLLQVALVQQSHTWNLALKAYRSILQQTIIWHRQRVCSK